MIMNVKRKVSVRHPIYSKQLTEIDVKEDVMHQPVLRIIRKLDIRLPQLLPLLQRIITQPHYLINTSMVL
uniref:Uncharacterized protein n=1 Tax=Wuchereria bancrofti TaxID=6293 RepID=A0A1I8EDD5_WUCBA